MTLQEVIIIWVLFVAAAIASLQVNFARDLEIELSSPAVLLDSVHGSVRSYLEDEEVKGALRKCSAYEYPGGALSRWDLLQALENLSSGGFSCRHCLDLTRILEYSHPSRGYVSVSDYEELLGNFQVSGPWLAVPFMHLRSVNIPYAYHKLPDLLVRRSAAVPGSGVAARNAQADRLKHMVVQRQSGYLPRYTNPAASGSPVAIAHGWPNVVWDWHSGPHRNLKDYYYATHEVEMPFLGPGNRVYEGEIDPAWWNKDWGPGITGPSSRHRAPHEGATLSLPTSAGQSFDGEPDEHAPFATAWVPCRDKGVYAGESRFASSVKDLGRALEFPPTLSQAGYLPRFMQDAQAAASGSGSGSGSGSDWMDLSDVVSKSFTDPDLGTAGFGTPPPGAAGFYMVGTVRFAGPNKNRERIRRREYGWSGSGSYEALVVAIGDEPVSRRDADEILARTRPGTWGFLHAKDSTTLEAYANDRSWAVGKTSSGPYNMNFAGIPYYKEKFARMHPVLCARIALAVEAAAGRLPDKDDKEAPWGYVAGTHSRLGPDDYRLLKMKMPPSVSSKSILGLSNSPKPLCGLPSDSSKGYFIARFRGDAY